MELDSLIDNLEYGEKIILDEGNYLGIDLHSESFSYSLEGNDKKPLIYYVSHNGNIKSEYSNVILNQVELNGNINSFSFNNVEFRGNQEISCKNSECTELLFENCLFGINYQIIVKKGVFQINIKNCIFKNSREIPIIFAKNSEVDITIQNCNFNVPLIYGLNSSVLIKHYNCTFKQLFFKEMSNFTVENLKNKIYRCKNCCHKCSSVKTISSDYYDFVEISKFIKFIRIVGKKSITIIPPENVNMGHRFQVYNESNFVIINNREYNEKLLNVILMEDDWFIY